MDTRIFTLLFTCLVMTACQTLPEGVTPAMATWLYGEHTLPAAVTRSQQDETFKPGIDIGKTNQRLGDQLKTGVKVPVAIYLHGCAGIRGEAYNYKELMLSEGYAFFMLDSYQRPGRERLCGQGGMAERVAMRQAEVFAALKVIRQMSQINQKNLVLMGFSEGGNTTDSWYTNDFAGLIVLGSACTNSGGSPTAPSKVPVLAIVGENDSYRPGLSCNISRIARGSKSIVIPGADHWVSHFDITKNAIKEFLGQCCKI